MSRSIPRIALATVATTALALAVGTAPAAAIRNIDYCGILVAPKSPCAQSLSSGGSFIYNVAYYNGSGTVAVCEKVLSAPFELSRRCNARDNIVGSGRDLNDFQGMGMDAYVGNDSAYNHTIWGTASAA